jgi:hypothetical protein
MPAQLIHRRYSRPVISGDPLMGRDNELALIRRTLGGVGKRVGVVIVGAPGVGKTRLAREVITRAATAGDRTHWIVGTESARPPPLGVFTPAIRVAPQTLSTGCPRTSCISWRNPAACGLRIVDAGAPDSGAVGPAEPSLTR